MSKRRIKCLTEGHKESAGPARLSSALNASTGTLCQDNAFSNTQENVCLTSGGFPFKTEKRAVVATGLGCTESSEFDQALQNRASRKVLLCCGGKH